MQNQHRNGGQLQQVYLTIESGHMKKGIATGNYSLFLEPSVLSYQLLNMLMRFLSSDIHLALDNSFKIKIKVLGEEHVLYRQHKKKNLIPHIVTENAGVRTNSKFHRWEFEIPDGFCDQPQAFVNKCVILAAYVAIYHKKWLKNPDSESGKIYMQMTDLWGRNIAKKKQAGVILNTLYLNFVERFKDQNIGPHGGPYDIGKVLTILGSEKEHNCVFHVYSDLTKSIYWTSVSENDFTKPQLYLLYKKGSEDNGIIYDKRVHISAMINPATWFNYFGYWCIDCKKIYREHHQIHRCATLKKCYPCRRFIAAPDFYLDSSNINFFCDQKLQAYEETQCKICRAKLTTETCREKHATECEKGFFCVECNTFRRKDTGETRKDVEARHVHGEKFCRICNSFVFDIKTHQCSLECPLPQKLWKNLAFFHFEYAISLLHEEDENVNDELIFEEKIFCCATEEDLRERFKLKMIVDPSLEIEDFEEHFKMAYLPDSKYQKLSDAPAMINSKTPVAKFRVKSFLKQIEQMENTNFLVSIIKFIFQEKHRNYAFVSRDQEDMHLILKASIQNLLYPKIVGEPNNLKVIYFQELNITFLNFQNYFDGSFWELSKSFSLDRPKYFPYRKMNDLYPTKFNFALEDFCTGGEVPEEKAEIELNYNEQKYSHPDLPWNKAEYLKSCNFHNLKILIMAALIYMRNIFDFQKDLPDFEDKLVHCFTYPICSAASLGYFIWGLFFPPHMLKAISDTGKYTNNTSQDELEFCQFMEHSYPDDDCYHSFSKNGQLSYCNIFPDFVSLKHKIIAWLHGCRIHGHLNPFCPFYKYRENIYEVPVEILATKFENQIKILKLEYPEPDFRYIVVYSCEWDKKKKDPQTPEYQFMECLFRQRPLNRLNPRDSLIGGRTDFFNLSWTSELQPDENFFIVDVNSLYPFIMLKHEFPCGTAKTLYEKNLDYLRYCPREKSFLYNNTKCMGILQCQILPPSNLKYPMLPYKCNDEIMYGNCRKCMENRALFCNHSKFERAITGVWTFEEIAAAIQRKYELLNMYEAVVYTEKCNPFRDYIAHLLKFKIKSGPKLTEDELESVNDILNLPTHLTHDMFEKSDAMKIVAKSLLVSFWGKFVPYIASGQTVLCHNFDEMMKYDNILSIECCNDDLAILQVKNYRTVSRKKNVIMGTYVVSFGRLFMLDKMEEIIKKKSNMSYSDTDSIFFFSKLSLKNHFTCSQSVPGEFKQEYRNSKIVSFFCLGCKNYSIVLQDTKTLEFKIISKCKGLSLTSSVAPNVTINEINLLLQKKTDLILGKIQQIRKLPKKAVDSLLKKHFIEIHFSTSIFHKKKYDETQKQIVPYGFKNEN